jgi:hypothetical protein
MPSSGIIHRVALLRTDVSEEVISTIITVNGTREPGKLLAVTINY